MYVCLQWLSAISALIAAAFWLCSALIHIPDTLDMALSGRNSPAGYMKRQSRWSAVAALFAAISAAAQAAALLSTLL
ncbi:MAG TPA: hypothetical protein VNU65_09335 [Xanthobacteraceae bacterium]|jgi:hypothetical protein|nr:hypothetical protein [Xanthobacteraceae bacterium]